MAWRLRVLRALREMGVAPANAVGVLRAADVLDRAFDELVSTQASLTETDPEEGSASDTPVVGGGEEGEPDEDDNPVHPKPQAAGADLTGHAQSPTSRASNAAPVPSRLSQEKGGAASPPTVTTPQSSPPPRTQRPADPQERRLTEGDLVQFPAYLVFQRQGCSSERCRALSDAMGRARTEIWVSSHVPWRDGWADSG